MNFLSNLGKRAQRYVFTLLVWNNIIGLFLSLALHDRSNVSFLKLYFLVLVISHTTGLVCLVAIDIFEFFVTHLGKTRLPYYLVVIIPSTIVLTPGLYGGFYMSTLVAQYMSIAWNPNFTMILKPGLLFGVLVTSFNIMHATQINRLQLQLQRERELAGTKHRLLETRLNLLSKELNPHILFNLIQNVLCLLHTDPNKAERMLENIAVFYQDVLLIFDKTSISLGEELRLIRLYASLNADRIHNFILETNNITPFAHFRLPPLLLQPLIENAIKHGLVPLPKEIPKRIVIDISQAKNSLIVKIIDNGQRVAHGADPKGGLHVGLKNCQARMQEFYGDKAQLKLETLTHGTCVTLDLPYEQYTE